MSAIINIEGDIPNIREIIREFLPDLLSAAEAVRNQPVDPDLAAQLRDLERSIMAADSLKEVRQ